jgi:PncC family amidohydrolase
VISYSNEVKRNVLGVESATLEKFGAVSSQTAAEMAVGARNLLKVDLAVALTGIAGPSGGTEGKPVGLVWFGLANKEGVRTEKAIFPGNREEVRNAAVLHAIGMLTVAASGALQ